MSNRWPKVENSDIEASVEQLLITILNVEQLLLTILNEVRELDEKVERIERRYNARNTNEGNKEI